MSRRGHSLNTRGHQAASGAPAQPAEPPIAPSVPHAEVPDAHSAQAVTTPTTPGHKKGFYEWLERNKIIFETIMVFMVSLASLIVGIVAAVIANKQVDTAAQQNGLIAKQLDVAREESELHKKESNLTELQTKVAETGILRLCRKVSVASGS
jgi:hypothetical protein